MYVYELLPTAAIHEGVNSMPGAVGANDSQDRTPSPLINQPCWAGTQNLPTRRDETTKRDISVDEERDLIDSPGDHLAKLSTADDEPDGILWCEISHDGCTYASCGLYGRICVWSAITAQPTFVLENHQKPVNCIKFDESDSVLASCSDDHTVKLWDLRHRHVMYTFNDHAAPVKCVCFVPKSNCIASAAENTVLVWNGLNMNGVIKTSVRLQSYCQILCIDVSPCGNFLAAGLLDFSIQVCLLEIVY